MARSASFVPEPCLAFDECGRGAHAKGYCLMHYKRIWRGGTAERPKTVPRGKSLDYNLRHYGWTVTEEGCWEYNGYQHPEYGYGFVYSGKETWMAHRAAYTAWVGPIPDGLFACHSCDNRICINPEHLWLGTNQDNMDDMKRKGRARNGQTGPIKERRIDGKDHQTT